MAYSSREQQQKYQREWVQRKKDGISKLDRKTGNSSRPIKGGIVTWEELQNAVKYDAIKTYDECVEGARKFMETKRTDRLAVAALAIRACEIKWGGSRRHYSSDDEKTVVGFAKAIGIHYKTLINWLRVLYFIRANIPKEAPIDYTAANIMIRDKAKSANDVLKDYTELLDPTSPARSSYNVLRFLSSARAALAMRGVAGWPKDKIEELLERMDDLNEAVALAVKK